MKPIQILQIISFVLLFYLILNIGSQLDFAAAKNEHLIAFRKAEIDKIGNIDTAKNEAKRNLDHIRNNFKDRSTQSETQLYVVAFLFVIQIFLVFTKPK